MADDDPPHEGSSGTADRQRAGANRDKSASAGRDGSVASASEGRTDATADERDGAGDAAVGAGIRLVDATKRYGAATALDGVTLTVEPGTFHGLVGPNGSGKTTLFRLVAGLTRPDAGRVEAEGAAGVGVGFQEPRFYPDLTVRENVSVFRRLSAAPVRDEWVETLYDELRLAPAVGRRADELSGGFRTKLDLALALLARPQYLLLDEPLADVDDPSRRRIRDFLERYRRADPDRTVVVSTHNVDAFAGSLDRLTVLVDGTVRLDERVDRDGDAGSAAAVVDRYRETVE